MKQETLNKDIKCMNICLILIKQLIIDTESHKSNQVDMISLNKLILRNSHFKNQEFQLFQRNY